MASKEDLPKINASLESVPLQELQVPEEYITSSMFKTPSGTMSKFDFHKMEWVSKWKFPEGFRFLEYVSQYLYPDCLIALNHVSKNKTELTVQKKMRLSEEQPVAKFIIQYSSEK